MAPSQLLQLGISLFVGILLASLAQADPIWKPVSGSLLTKWAADISAEHPLPEYPRPGLVRAEWMNLNGLWDYSITDKNVESVPAAVDGKILIPYPIESALSGVKRPLDPDQRLWYSRQFDVPSGWLTKRLLLHFGAVNWETTVYLNGKKLGSHLGGYDAFSFDVTSSLVAKGPQTIVVEVSNPSDTSWQMHGKLVLHPAGCNYTDCSGIWQTVWLEPLPVASVEDLHLVTDIDTGIVHLTVSGEIPLQAMSLRVTALAGEKVVGTVTGQAGAELTPEVMKNILDFYKATSTQFVTELDLPISEKHLWSPDDPFLYDLKVEILDDKGKAIDTVKSFFGLRQIQIGHDAQGYAQLFLNHQRILLPGALDQGFWPDGIYTAPTDEALRFDIEAAKKLGLMAVRKHVKVEPERWYYWADKLGLLVLQDMPTGREGDPFTDRAVSPEAAAQCEMEMRTLIRQRWNHPSIICWIMYNEGWGQHDTAATAQWAHELDPTRLIDEASGFPWHGTGDVIDHHGGIGAKDETRISIVSENGGWGLRTPGHDWSGHEWTYRTYDPATGGDTSGMDKERHGAALPACDDTSRRWFTQHMIGFYSELWKKKDTLGETGNFFCQLIDVEDECDGLLSYDRAVWKVDPDQIRPVARGEKP